VRLSARNCQYRVDLAPASEQPIRLRIGCLTFCMNIAEALALGNQIADAISQTQRRKP
jgi:hypothetical protein